jgi:CDP-diacylglycerol--glycerol-3-phosphate 3-phosphatidyltransferase
MADAIVHLSVFFTFTKGMVSLPLILVFFLLYRELIISALRTLCALRGYALAARKSGKIKAFMQGFCAFFIVFLMIFYNHNFISLRFLQRVSFFLILVAVIYSSATLVDYFYANRKYIKKLLE